MRQHPHPHPRSTDDARRGVWRLLAVLLTLALVAAACTGGDDEAADPAPDAADAQDGDSDQADATTGGSTADGPAATTALAWLADTYGLEQAILDGLAPAGITTSPGVQHVRFAQQVEGLEVIGGAITVHVLDDGSVQTATDDLVVGASTGSASPAVDEAQAVDVAGKAVTGDVEGTPTAMLVWLRNGMNLSLAWRVELATSSPTSSWVIVVDATSGRVVSADEADFGRDGVHSHAHPGDAAGVRMVAAARDVAQAGGDACQAPVPGACVFLPDPIYAAGGTLDDRSRANEFVVGVDLQGLGDPTALIGEFVDTEPPGVPVEPTREADSTWATGRAGRGFEAAMAYYWIDRVQRQMQRLGFTDILARPFPVFPVDPDVVDNAFYSPAEGAVHLGVGSDGVNEGEDASGIVHEYGHAVLDAQAPGLIGGGGAGAYHESFGDLLAFLTTLSGRTGDAGCLFAWAEAGQCLRRVDSPKVYPDDLVQEVHADGEIYNGAIYDITAGLLQTQGLDITACPGTTDCDEVLDRVLATLLAANSYLSNDPSLPDVAQTFVLANEAAFGGADADLIAGVFAARGLADGGSSMVDSGGQAMGATEGVTVGVDITHTYRGDLDLTVGVVDADLNDLCEPVSLFTPDDTDDEDNLIGEVDISDTGCAAFAPPGPGQIWYLHAIDTLPEDEGQINGFTVNVAGVPYLAPGLPLPIGDADPDGVFAVIDGTGEASGPGAGSGVDGEVAAGVPVVSIDITHTYVGDLDISAGVVDADASIVCAVQILEPDASNSNNEGVAGDVDMGECAALYPPSPSQRWFLLVTDTASIDEGTVDAFTLTGPDGATFNFDGVPVAIPDADVDGVALLLDGTGGAAGQAGGGGTTTDLTASVAISHTYQGDLAVTVGVLSADEVLCEVALATPDQENNAQDLLIEGASVADCARFYPPTPSQPWYLFVADTLTEDVGTVEAFQLAGPDGAVFTAAGLPVDLPDADPSGVVLLVDGSGGAAAPPPPPDDGGGGGEVTGAIDITHSYVGDLEINAGVAAADGSVLCEVSVRTPDPADSSSDLGGQFSFGECSSLYPLSGGAVFYVEVIDTAAQDTGQINALAVTGPDGQTVTATNLPAPIPDADPSGVVVAL